MINLLLERGADIEARGGILGAQHLTKLRLMPGWERYSCFSVSGLILMVSMTPLRTGGQKRMHSC